MKILICSAVWAPSIGGVQSVTSTLARGLAREWSEDDDDPIEVTVATGSSDADAPDSDDSFRLVRDAGIAGLIRLIWRSDIVLLSGPALLPLILTWILRKKAVIQHHGYQAVCPDGSLVHFVEQRVCKESFAAGGARQCLNCRTANLGRLRGIVDIGLAYPRLWLCRQVAANVTVSNHLSRRLALPRSKTIYNAPAENSALPFPMYGTADTTPPISDAPMIAFVGRLTLEKGVSILLQAASSLAAEDAEFRLRIIGDGPERARLAILAWALGLRDRVEFTGWLQGHALENAIAGAFAIVVPSLAEETGGLVAAEQMMRGRVIVASDIGGLGEIVGNAGLKFPPGDVPALEACLRRVLSEPELRMMLGRAARTRALEHFTQEQMLEDWKQIYARIFARPARAQWPARMISRALPVTSQKRAS